MESLKLSHFHTKQFGSKLHYMSESYELQNATLWSNWLSDGDKFFFWQELYIFRQLSVRFIIIIQLF